MRSRHALWLATAAAVAWLPVRAEADSLETTFGSELREVSHKVSVRRDGDVARFTVRRVVRNLGASPEQAELTFDLPSGGVVHGFRHRSAGAWITGVLMNASKARGVYDELTGDAGKARPRGPALLAYEELGKLHATMYPVPKGGTVAIEYRVEAPLCYRGGYYITDYGWVEDELENLARPAIKGARVVDGKGMRVLIPGVELDELCSGIGHRIETRSRYLVFAGPKLRGPARARLGHHRVDDAHQLVRVEVAVPKVIEPVPRGARVVFAIDASHSVGADGVRDQLQLIDGYLAHVPDARVEIVVVRRAASRLFGSFVPARSVGKRLAAVHAHRLRPGNGSNLEYGVALAGHLLATERRPARVVAFTDDRLRPSFQAQVVADLAATLPEHAVLHIVDMHASGGDYAWERDDDSRLLGIARARGGVVATMRGSGNGVSAIDAMLGLVRPLTIDDVQLEIPNLQTDDIEVPETFSGGDGFRHMWMAKAAPKGAHFTGMIWGRHWTHSLAPDRALSARMPRLAFGHEVSAAIPESRRYPLAMTAGVVSEATSFLSRDPRALPTNHDPRGVTGRSFSCGCGGVRSVGIRCGGVRGIGRRGIVAEPDRNAILRSLLHTEVRMCTGRAHGDQVSVTVHTTGHEVVDVSVTAAHPDVSACTTEAAWRLALPPEVYDRSTGAYTAAF